MRRQQAGLAPTAEDRSGEGVSCTWARGQGAVETERGGEDGQRGLRGKQSGGGIIVIDMADMEMASGDANENVGVGAVSQRDVKGVGKIGVRMDDVIGQTQCTLGLHGGGDGAAESKDEGACDRGGRGGGPDGMINDDKVVGEQVLRAAQDRGRGKEPERGRGRRGRGGGRTARRLWWGRGGGRMWDGHSQHGGNSIG